MAKGSLKVCSLGHQFFKSSDCPVCPICEQERKPEDGFLSLLGAPARRALKNAEITSLKLLAKKKDSELLQLHGLGPSTIPKLRQALRSAGLKFRDE